MICEGIRYRVYFYVKLCINFHLVTSLLLFPIQRWNHHRISASHYSEPVLYDITDNTNYGVCARCLTDGLSEAITICTKCGYDLGNYFAVILFLCSRWIYFFTYSVINMTDLYLIIILFLIIVCRSLQFVLHPNGCRAVPRTDRALFLHSVRVHLPRQAASAVPHAGRLSGGGHGGVVPVNQRHQ